MSAMSIVLNYHDYAALPADGRRYELHEGELSVIDRRLVLRATGRAAVGPPPFVELGLVPDALWPS
jgi:hypothetical protein